MNSNDGDEQWCKEVYMAVTTIGEVRKIVL